MSCSFSSFFLGSFVGEGSTTLFAHLCCLSFTFRVAVTNKKEDIHYSVCYNPYQPGQKLCNLFFPDTDCVVVDQNGCVPVYLDDGEVKIFYPV